MIRDPSPFKGKDPPLDEGVGSVLLEAIPTQSVEGLYLHASSPIKMSPLKMVHRLSYQMDSVTLKVIFKGDIWI